MNIMVFDTETIGLENPFCYNIGIIIADENGSISSRYEWTIDEVFNNNMLFEMAYYKKNRQYYIDGIRRGEIQNRNYKYVMEEIHHIIKKYNVSIAYAYNSNFDEKVFKFNSEWFHTRNPLEEVKVIDIRGFVHNSIAFAESYKGFCEEHNLFTDSGNYSTTAETVYKFITLSDNFKEAHTALADCEIELKILNYCAGLGMNIYKPYKTYRSIPRKKTVEIVVKNGKIKLECEKIRFDKRNSKIIIK